MRLDTSELPFMAPEHLATLVLSFFVRSKFQRRSRHQRKWLHESGGRIHHEHSPELHKKALHLVRMQPKGDHQVPRVSKNGAFRLLSGISAHLQIVVHLNKHGECDLFGGQAQSPVDTVQRAAFARPFLRLGPPVPACLWRECNLLQLGSGKREGRM